MIRRLDVPIARWGAGIALAALAGAMPLPASGTEAAVPRLQAVESERSFGVVTPDTLVEEAFLLRNAGGAPLTLEVYSPGGRARVLERPEELAPGEEGKVRVRVDLRRQRGMLEIPFQVMTNDPERPELYLVLSGEVKDYVVAQPGHARWLMVQGEVDGTIRQTLRAEGHSPFEITRVEVPRPGLLAETHRDGDTWFVELTMDRWAPEGPVTGEVVVHTTHPEQPRVLIPISGYVRPILVLEPPELVGEVELVEETEQEIRVLSFATDPIALLRVEHELPGVPPARIVSLEEGRLFAVILTLGPDVPKGRLESELRIVTDNPNIPEVRIPVDAFIR